MTALAVLAGVTATAGLLLAVAGIVGTTSETAHRWRLWTAARRGPGGRRSRDRPVWRRWAVRVGVPLLVLVVTGWPVAAVLAVAATVGLPRLLGGRRAAEARIARLEALADWTRRLAGVLSVGAGLEQAIEASIRTAPAPIAPDINALVARLHARTSLQPALRGFADDLNDPTGDLVVAALLLAADRRGRGLAKVLTGLAATVEAEVAMRRAVEADRAAPRTTARWVCYLTLGVTAALFGLNRSYVAPFATPTGQLALLVVGALFAAAFTWMYQLTRTNPGQRFLPAGTAAGRAR